MKYENIGDIPWDEVLPFVERPGRYVGGEVHCASKDRKTSRLSFALAFPDTYEVGMSHLGLQILYAILNSRSDLCAERFFAPWPDMESKMREMGIPLCSLENKMPLSAFDIVGFSLQYELTYTNVLNMLDLGGIALYADDRAEGAPIVIGGGPCAFNPLPMAPFFDAFVIGEGEEVITEIALAVIKGKQTGASRKQKLQRLTAIEGVYVPSLHREGQAVRKRTVRDLNEWLHPLKPIVPILKTIHDRVNLEIARGCTRGCRFCQAGMVWRPLRERRQDILESMAASMLASSGCGEISLLSLSSGDYSRIEDLLSALMNRYQKERVAIGLPSLRVETLTPQLMAEIKRVRKTSFTLAPEAGTQRLRNVINKGNTAEDLLMTTRQVFDAGWRSVKLYFMLGLPGERDGDLDGIVDLSKRVLREGGSKSQVTVSVSTFIPKPHTPFQWATQISLEQTRTHQAYLRRRLNVRNLVYKWHDAGMSLIEGIFSRGDVELAGLVERAFKLGCRFDGWTDCFRFDLWEKAMAECRVSPERWLNARALSAALPWDFIDCGIEQTFLLGEWDKALREQTTEDCRRGVCCECGVCKGPLKNLTVHDEVRTREQQCIEEKDTSYPGERKKWRICFSRTGPMRFLSHLEIASALIRGIKQGGLTLVYSEGFHPHTRVSFVAALPVGVESLSEYADLQLIGPVTRKEEVLRRINALLPAGLTILTAEEISFQAASLSDMIQSVRYEFPLPARSETVRQKIQDFMQTKSFAITRIRHGKTVEKDIRFLVERLDWDEATHQLRSTVRFRADGGVKPIEILTEILGIEETSAKKVRIVKTETVFKS